ncbi:MAG: MgtC/SapB family protein [Lentisphaeraceae bacterium]|nr:MgtC/SapB family protein [Lentisphaeraceae bacterium]
MDIYDFTYKCSYAVLAGFLMGLERQMKGKPAGLKTNALVALGSCVFVLVCLQFKTNENVDITRIIGNIATGVGFLGAGAIMQRKAENKVNGLATAATIWCSAGAGIVAALGYYQPLMVFIIMVVLINLVLGYLNSVVEKQANKQDPQN